MLWQRTVSFKCQVTYVSALTFSIFINSIILYVLFLKYQGYIDSMELNGKGSGKKTYFSNIKLLSNEMTII